MHIKLNKVQHMKKTFYAIYILLISFSVNQTTDSLTVIQTSALQYYNNEDYSNAIILYEDLLAKQESIYGKNDIRVGETLFRLGELYLLNNLIDISDYYFEESTQIFHNAFQSGKNSLEKPLINLLQIYTFQNDTVMINKIENQLNAISNIFESPNNIFSYITSCIFGIIIK